MGINEVERESVSENSKNRRPRTRPWVWAEATGAEENREHPEWGKRAKFLHLRDQRVSRSCLGF